MPQRRLPLVVHERLATWARQLRPRVAGWPVHLVETRSAADLRAALAPGRGALVLIDLARGPARGLDDLARCGDATADALVLVLDPGAHPGVPTLARELGAAHVLTGPVNPPEVVGLLDRWCPLALRRAGRDGWGSLPEPVLEPWERALTAPL